MENTERIKPQVKVMSLTREGVIETAIKILEKRGSTLEKFLQSKELREANPDIGMLLQLLDKDDPIFEGIELE